MASKLCFTSSHMYWQIAGSSFPIPYLPPRKRFISTVNVHKHFHSKKENEVKALLARKTWQKYKEEKLLAMKEDEGGDSDSEDDESGRKRTERKPLLKVKVIRSRFKKTALGRYLSRYKTKNTKENVCIKSLIGFVGGVILTYIYFLFFYFALHIPLQATTYICVISGIILSLGLAFSKEVRCYVLLMIPVFFSKEGRQVLLTYAMYLSLTGPVKNTMQNMAILSDSLSCGQEMIRKALKQIEDMVKAPFRALKETMAKVLKTLKDVIQKIKAFLDNVKRIIMGILNVIKKAVSWLGSIINFCNKKLGTPFQRCMKTFDDAIEDCKAKMGIMDFLCHIVHVVRALCYTVKFLDLICMFKEFVSESIIGVVKKKLKDFGTQVKTMFYVSIEFSHHYEYSMESSNSTKVLAKTLVNKLAERFEKLEKLFHFLGWAFSFFFIFIFFSVIYYKHKYLSSDRYDNRYLTSYFVELDLRRVKMDRETVLPLERREKKHFCWPTSLRLLKEEQKSVLKALMIMSLTTVKIASFVVADYCLYWVLFTIHEAGHKGLTDVGPAHFELKVSGLGAMADFYRRLGKVLRVPTNAELALDPLSCLPDPVPPDQECYKQIGYLTGLCWFLAVTEAYGLRLRNIVMSHYYPDRAKERAVWLYNHILRSRGNFLKFARRQLRRKVKGGAIEKVTIKDRMFAMIPLLAIVFGKKENACLLCGEPGTLKTPLWKCPTPNCVGIYCEQCFKSIRNVCPVCHHPIDYGDLTDISEEKDSSDESFDTEVMKKHSSGDTAEEVEIASTFLDMETRPKFRDVEENRKKDYAHPSDLDPGTKDTGEDQIQKYMNKPEAYEAVRAKARQMLTDLKRQQAEKKESLTKRSSELVRSLRAHLQEKRETALSSEDEQPRSASRVLSEKETTMKPEEAKKTISNADYDAMLRRARSLTERLKERTSEELMDNRVRQDEARASIEEALDREVEKENRSNSLLLALTREKVKRKLSERKREREDSVHYQIGGRPDNEVFAEWRTWDGETILLPSHRRNRRDKTLSANHLLYKSDSSDMNV